MIISVKTIINVNTATGLQHKQRIKIVIKNVIPDAMIIALNNFI